MLLMDRGVMESPLQDDPIGKRPQATVRRGIGVREESVRIINVP